MDQNAKVIKKQHGHKKNRVEEWKLQACQVVILEVSKLEGGFPQMHRVHCRRYIVETCKTATLKISLLL